MKNLFAILSIALLAVSCSSGKKYIVEGTAPESLNNQLVYLFDIDVEKNIDSTLVTEGKFRFEGTASTVALYSITDVTHQFNMLFIPEAGSTTVNLEERSFVSTTPLNTEMEKINTEFNELNQSAKKDFDELTEEFKETPELLQQKQNEFINSFSEKLETFFKGYFDKNTNNSVGKYAYILWVNNGQLPLDKQEELITQMGEELKQTKMIQTQLENIEKSKATAAGSMFTDFTIENGNLDGTPASLSDYVGKGKYVLVDFWASWCGPCIREFPTLREVYQQHKGDKFELLGVAVWDKRDDTTKAIDQHEIAWPVIIDAQKIPTDIYNIGGIPEIILFGPDGTIIARGLRGEELKAKVAEELAKL